MGTANTNYKIKAFKEFINESKVSLDIWNDLMDKYDLTYYKQYLSLSTSDLEQMREDWKEMRRLALIKLNSELNASGKSGQLMSIDVSDEELYPYIDDKNKTVFFKYSRILDFSDGYKPKGLVLIKKGM